GVVFDAGAPEAPEQGGPIFGVEPRGEGRWILRFGRPGPDLDRVAPGARVWLSGDPAAARAAERLGARAGLEPGGAGGLGRVPLHLEVRGAAGEPLAVRARARHAEAAAVSGAPLAPARGAGLDRNVLSDKL